ncbi:hypothetical protein MCEMIEM13_01533 [Comamonadaceae bacterium]
MPYINKDAFGRIVGVFANQQYEGQEFQEDAEIWEDPKEAIRAQIAALEQKQLMPRATREYMLLDLEYRFPAEVLAVNPGYQAVKAFDEQIKALRVQL